MTKTIDIHGMTGHEAEVEVNQQLYSIVNSPSSHITKLHVIFGKGTRTLEQCVIDEVEREGFSYTIPNDGAIIINI